MICEVLVADRRNIISTALGEKSFGRSRAEGAFRGEVHGREVMIQWDSASKAGMVVLITCAAAAK